MQDLTPLRPAFWNVPLWAEIGVYVIGIAAVVLCIAGIVRAVKQRQASCPPEALPDRNARLGRTLLEVFWQKRIRDTAAGKNHFVLFWGFIFLFFGTAIATIDWDIAWLIFGKRILSGNIYLAYKFVLDLAGLLALIALGFSFWRRFISHDPKVEANWRFALVLGSLAFIILTGFLLEALRLAVQQPQWAGVSFVGNALAQIFIGTAPETLKVYHTFIWVIHGLASLGFIASIPLTYYAHLFKTPTSIYVKKPEPRGALAKIENIEEQERFGISEFSQFGRIDRIRFDGCTECGRCTSVCPAAASGAPLDPKALILSLKARMNGDNADKPLIDGIVSKDALWSCTTCGACTKVCPAQIPTPDIIVQMRRHLALEEGDFPEGLAQALENTSSVGNPWGMDPGSRLKWAKGLDVEIAKPGVEYDVLYWVGCSASYDRRAQKIARAMVEIFHAAGVKFAVMSEERCHGEFARRAGEEYLFQMAAAENIESLSKYNFKKTNIRSLRAAPSPSPATFSSLPNCSKRNAFRQNRRKPAVSRSTTPVTSHVITASAAIRAQFLKQSASSSRIPKNAAATPCVAARAAPKSSWTSPLASTFCVSNSSTRLEPTKSLFPVRTASPCLQALRPKLAGGMKHPNLYATLPKSSLKPLRNRLSIPQRSDMPCSPRQTILKFYSQPAKTRSSKYKCLNEHAAFCAR